MKWYRLRHDLPFDPRFAPIAAHAGLTRGETLAFWIALLDYASKADKRGSVAGVDIDVIASALDLPCDACLKALEILRRKKMILSGGVIADWLRDQTTSTARVQAHRDRKKQQERRDADDPSEQAARRQRLMKQRKTKGDNT